MYELRKDILPPVPILDPAKTTHTLHTREHLNHLILVLYGGLYSFQQFQISCPTAIDISACSKDS